MTDCQCSSVQATHFLRQEGPQLVDNLTDQYVNETVGLIDTYAERVVNRTQGSVGRCEPLSASYNATVIAVCNQIVDPFNGLWTSVGWCLMFFLPSIVLALALVSLYRKSEPYPGPLVESVPSEEALQMQQHHPRASSHAKKKRRGHRRNASEYLPDSAHYRAGYSYQDRENRFRDIAPRNSGAGGGAASTSQAPPPQQQQQQQQSSGSSTSGPPCYSSNPALDAPPAEYERPPPYYYPGTSGEAPPPLPAPNRS